MTVVYRVCSQQPQKVCCWLGRAWGWMNCIVVSQPVQRVCRYTLGVSYCRKAGTRAPATSLTASRRNRNTTFHGYNPGNGHWETGARLPVAGVLVFWLWPTGDTASGRSVPGGGGCWVGCRCQCRFRSPWSRMAPPTVRAVMRDCAQLNHLAMWIR